MWPTLRQYLEYLAPKIRQIPKVPAAKLVRCDTFPLRDEAQQQVLSSDVVVLQTVRFGDAQFDGTFRELAEADRRRSSLAGRVETSKKGCPQFPQFDPMLHEHMCRNTIALLQQSQEEMLRSNLHTAQSNGFTMGQVQHGARALRELIETVAVGPWRHGRLQRAGRVDEIGMKPRIQHATKHVETRRE